MARNRMIKPDFWSDEKTGNLSDRAKLLYIGMLNFADDEGLIRYNPTYLRSCIFPYHDILIKDIKTTLKELEQFLYVYTVNNQTYARLKNFKRHQVINKPQPTKLPLPDDSRSVPVALPEQVSTKVKEKEKEKVKEKEDNNIVQQKNVERIAFESFSQFWSIYPKHIGKQKAISAWKKLKPDAELIDVILRSVDVQKQSEQWQKDNGQFIPLPATWLNGKRWEDEIPIGNGKSVSHKYDGFGVKLEDVLKEKENTNV